MKIYNASGIEQQTHDIEKLVIYGHGKILYQIERNCFERCNLTENKAGEKKVDTIYNGYLESIVLSGEIKRALKENLDRKDNYTLNYKSEFSFKGTCKALYIHESEIQVVDLGDVLAMETDEEKNYLHTCKLIFKNPIEVRNLHCEKIPCDDHWTIPGPGKWGNYYGTKDCPMYDTYNNEENPFSKRRAEKDPTYNIKEKGVIKRWYTIDTIENAAIYCTERYYTKTEYSEERKRKNALADALNNSGLFKERFSNYDIDKLEKVFNITLKK